MRFLYLESSIYKQVTKTYLLIQIKEGPKNTYLYKQICIQN